jgi:hypothetical protein
MIPLTVFPLRCAQCNMHSKKLLSKKVRSFIEKTVMEKE